MKHPVSFPLFGQTLLRLAISVGPLQSPAVNFYRYFYHSIFPLPYFHISRFPYFPTCQFPYFHILQFSCLHTLLRRAISVGPLGGRQGCHCQPPLSPPDANAAEKSAPSHRGIKLVLNRAPGLSLNQPSTSPSTQLFQIRFGKEKTHCYYSRMFISYTID